eukprot:GEMP01035454.1.p1 GENE.GEMP01035454.1~~GEMP01035454.1.p1  ORF type:complete len:205 (+),score=59.94 GEMP01035454.1:100-714(+)
MAPKPKKADAKNVDPESAEKEENLKKLEHRRQVLQDRLMMKDELLLTCLSAEDQYRQKQAQLDKLFDQERERSSDVTGEMSRQYREMQDSFNERIEDLQEQVSQSKQEIEAVQQEVERTRLDKDDILRLKDEEIRSLTLKMETMAFEYADMLKETLDKMSQRIEVTHSTWDRGGKPPLMNRLKEFSLNEAPEDAKEAPAPITNS